MNLQIKKATFMKSVKEAIENFNNDLAELLLDLGGKLIGDDTVELFDFAMKHYFNENALAGRVNGGISEGKYDNKRIVKILMGKRQKLTTYDFNNACVYADLEMVKDIYEVLKKDRSLDANNVIKNLSKCRDMEIANFLIKTFGYTGKNVNIQNAAHNGKLELLKFGIEDASKTEKEMALYFALSSGEIECAKELLPVVDEIVEKSQFANLLKEAITFEAFKLVVEKLNLTNEELNKVLKERLQFKNVREDVLSIKNERQRQALKWSKYSYDRIMQDYANEELKIIKYLLQKGATIPENFEFTSWLENWLINSGRGGYDLVQTLKATIERAPFKKHKNKPNDVIDSDGEGVFGVQ